jgi:hypothetical protein
MEGEQGISPIAIGDSVVRLGGLPPEVTARMEALPHQPLIDGDIGALGDTFRPAPASVVAAARRRLVSPNEAFPQLIAAATTFWTLTLELPVNIVVYMLSSDGRRLTTAMLPGGSAAAPKPYKIYAPDASSYTYIVVESTSGAYVTGFNAKSGDDVLVGAGTLRPVNNPGLPDAPGELPTPSRSGSPLPADSPPVLVGAGVLTDSNGKEIAILARTQHWQKSEDSYSLPGCASLSVTLTKSSGVTRSSSAMSSIATAVGVSASFGWGPISASMSASMSQSSTTSQDVSISDTTEATVVRTLRNLYTTPIVVFLWQLVDRVLILDPNGYKLTAMVESVTEPVIPKTYDSQGGSYPPIAPVLCVKPKPDADQGTPR